MKTCKKCRFYYECSKELKGELNYSINNMAVQCERYEKTVQKNKQSAETLSELDMFAMGFVIGTVNIKYIMELDMLNRCLVFNLAAIYSCARIGFLSSESAMKSKYAIIQSYKQFRTETYFQEQEHLQWTKRNVEVSTKLSELTKAICNHSTNALNLALEIIDLLTREDIYNKMFFQMQLDSDYKKRCVQELKNADDFMFSHFGNIPYIDLLFKFYNACEENRATEIFKQLDDDNIKQVARRVPIKKDDIKGIVKSYRELLKI